MMFVPHMKHLRASTVFYGDGFTWFLPFAFDWLAYEHMDPMVIYESLHKAQKYLDTKLCDSVLYCTVLWLEEGIPET
jgi:hypothetical protein